jgi:hypothetical protein
MTAIPGPTTLIQAEPRVYELSDEDYFGPQLAMTTLSSTGARELLKPGGPARFRHKLDTGTVEVKREYDLGHAVHTMVLGAGPQVVVIAEEKWLTKDVKEKVANVRAEGNVPLRPSDYGAAVVMAAAVRDHPLAAKLFTGGEPERTLIWRDPATGVMCRCKVDYLRRDGMVDLKTAASAAPDALSKDAYNYGYYVQEAFYLRGHQAIWPGPEPFFTHVVVEKEPPYLVHVTQLTLRAAAYGDRKVSEALEIYRDCTAAGEWPGYPTDEITDIDLPGWVRTEEG